ncbi:MAG: phytoene desaturase [Bacteroidales bacterium]|nr:phytoene desaturase [Bacteroidales bacterium]
MPKVLIVGAGLGGLTTALRLAKKGYQVSIVEKYKQAGGRLNQLRRNGFVWDIGPSRVSMSYVFKEFCDECGIDIPFKLIELENLYSINFKDNNKTYNVYKNLKKLSEEFKDLEPDLEKKIIAYLSKAGKIFEDTQDVYFKKNICCKIQNLVTLSRLPLKHVPKVLHSLWSTLGKYFDSNEVKETLNISSFFFGPSHKNTPSIFSSLSYIEMVHDGYYDVQDGMYKIVEGLLREVEKAGVEIVYNSEITGYIGSKKHIYSLIDHTGEAHRADLYVINSDAAYFRNKVFERKKYRHHHLNKMHWTPAAFTIYLGLSKKIDELHKHHYFLGDDNKLFSADKYTNPDDGFRPSYYVNVSSRSNPLNAPEGCESVSIYCPIPNHLKKSDWTNRDVIVDIIIKDLSSRIGVNVNSLIIEKIVFDPQDWENNFNLFKGSGFGLSHVRKQLGGHRPCNRDEKFRNVFYVGSSTIPGSGLPMSVISSKLVTERIVRSF